MSRVTLATHVWWSEFLFPISGNVLPDYPYIVIPIHATLFVLESKAMHNFMLNLTDELDLACLEVDHLLSLSATDVWVVSAELRRKFRWKNLQKQYPPTNPSVLSWNETQAFSSGNGINLMHIVSMIFFNAAWITCRLSLAFDESLSLCLKKETDEVRSTELTAFIRYRERDKALRPE